MKTIFTSLFFKVWALALIIVHSTLLNLTYSEEKLPPMAPEELVKNIFSVAQKENPLKNQATKKLLDSHFDFRQMSMTILGEESKKRTQVELNWFEESIREIITLTVYPKAPEFLKNVKITYRTPLIEGQKATIPSTITKKGESTDVSYTLLKKGSDWKVVDVSIDDESWAQTINEKMLKSLKEKGWSGVKELLSNKLKDLKKKQ